MYKETGYTGGVIEEEFFGKKIEEENPNEPKPQFVKFHVAVEEVKKSPSNNEPSNPESRIANDLHATLADRLGLEDYDTLRFYNALGSVLDKRHSVDAFFEYDVEIENRIKTIRVTLDITKNPNKEDGHKADVIILAPPDGIDPTLKEDKEKYKQLLDKVVGDILEVINYKYDLLMSGE